MGWRRVFCTSIRKDGDCANSTSKQEKIKPITPKFTSKFGFFSSSASTPSTPRLQSQPVSTPRLRCRTTFNTPPDTPPAPDDLGPKHQFSISKNSPRFSLRSNPSSPRSPSTLSILKSINSLRLSKKTRCGLCLHSMKSGQATAIFTAECRHDFHFPCIAGHVTNKGLLTCPVCNAHWTDLPQLPIQNLSNNRHQEQVSSSLSSPRTPAAYDREYSSNGTPRSILKVYNDDEPLRSPKSGGLFNPIPESDEIDEANEDMVGEFQGFFPHRNTNILLERVPVIAGSVEMEIMPDAAVVSVGRGNQTCVIILKVKAPPAPVKITRRAPIDLVTVIDVSGKSTNQKLQLIKRVMRFVVSSMTSADRLSIVAFSTTTSKRLLPLKRMTAAGRRTARRIVEAIVPLDGTAALSAKDAVKKATKVLEDRRERNPAASILLLSNSNCRDDRSDKSRTVRTTRLPHLEIPVHTIYLTKSSEYDDAPSSEEYLGKCVGRLLCLVVQDLHVHLGIVSGSAPGEISGVYSVMGGSYTSGSGLIRVGDLYAEEERELLVELKVPSMTSVGAHRLLSVRTSSIDPSTHKLIQGKEHALLVPRPPTARSSNPNIERLRGLFVTTQAVAESRRLVEKRNDVAGAYHILSTARTLLLQSRAAGWAAEFVGSLEVELSELQKNQMQMQQRGRRNQNVEAKSSEPPLTPTSAWRAAERLAKVAMVKKSLNRVSDLHGFENARF